MVLASWDWLFVHKSCIRSCSMPFLSCCGWFDIYFVFKFPWMWNSHFRTVSFTYIKRRLLSLSDCVCVCVCMVLRWRVHDQTDIWANGLTHTHIRIKHLNVNFCEQLWDSFEIWIFLSLLATNSHTLQTQCRACKWMNRIDIVAKSYSRAEKIEFQLCALQQHLFLSQSWECQMAGREFLRVCERNKPNRFVWICNGLMIVISPLQKTCCP